MRAADVIVKALEAQRLTRLYCVPGESYLPLLDALHDSKALTTCYRPPQIRCRLRKLPAKLTGRPACFMVSRGPGATNGSIRCMWPSRMPCRCSCWSGRCRATSAAAAPFRRSITPVLRRHRQGGVGDHRCREGAEIMVRAFAAPPPAPGPVVVVLPEDVLDDHVTRPLPLPIRSLDRMPQQAMSRRWPMPSTRHGGHC